MSRHSFPFLSFSLPFLFLVLFFSGISGELQAQNAASLFGKHSFPDTQTCGGMFFWQDVKFFQEWHIQKSVLTGEYRLLDPQAVCRASGDRDFCEEELAGWREDLGLSSMKGRVLILVHGFASSSILLENMALWFRAQGEYSAVLNVSYPSAFVTVEEETVQIAEIIAALEGVERIDFVGHSMGAIVLRYYLGNYAQKTETEAETENETEAENETEMTAKGAAERASEKTAAGKLTGFPVSKIGRFVQICPPNQGSVIAQNHNAGPVGLFLPALEGLSLSGGQMQERFGTPCCEFGILAGYGEESDSEASDVFNGEENDAVLPVSATKLEGAAGWKKIRGDHSTIPNRVETFENVQTFLNSGHFLSENPLSPP